MFIFKSQIYIILVREYMITFKSQIYYSDTRYCRVEKTFKETLAWLCQPTRWRHLVERTFLITQFSVMLSTHSWSKKMKSDRRLDDASVFEKVLQRSRTEVCQTPCTFCCYPPWLPIWPRLDNHINGTDVLRCLLFCGMEQNTWFRKIPILRNTSKWAQNLVVII